MPAPTAMARFRPGTGQRFLLTIDTEEEFDWTKPFGLTEHRVDTIPRLRKFQQFCEGYGIVPVYLVDYPIACSPVAADVLNDALAAGRAEVGIQLHPWVNPPHDEVVNEYNSFAGNLPVELEREKLFRLRDKIIETFGQVPRIYRAGRYGTGPNTAKLLREAGVAIDTSARARFDYSGTGGPNYRDLPLHPWWVGETGSLLELPLTSVFAGIFRKWGPWLYPALWRTPRLRGLLSKIGLLERIPLTPEGVTALEALRALDVAVDEGLPVLILSFHSPSLYPGFTPYVRDERDLDALYDWWRQVFDNLIARGVMPTSVKEIMESVELA
ncbi:MAG: polysaccharide deacetylase family protein [Sphingomonadales bacterium]|nr:polysaccharide deacetylase family protein [Sphingomonadales bacterium]